MWNTLILFEGEKKKQSLIIAVAVILNNHHHKRSERRWLGTARRENVHSEKWDFQ